MSRTRTLSALFAAAVIAATSALLGLGLSTSASAATANGSAAKSTGWVRLAHLSPDTGPVDVTLTPYGKQTTAMTANRVTYGSVSPYSNLPAGFYTVSMRPAGTPASQPAMLTSNFSVAAGKAYTVIASGPKADLTDRVVTDDLSAPPAGKARLRLIQGSTDPSKVNVTAVMGPVLARDAAYGTVTGYAAVPQGRWTLQVTGNGKTTATPTVDLAAGTVHSVLVINGADGKQMVKTVTDAAAVGAAPKGGVETGVGGAAPNAAPSSLDGRALGLGLAGAGVLLAAITLLPQVRRRWAR